MEEKTFARPKLWKTFLADLDRLTHLLVLFQLAQLGLDDEASWAATLQKQHMKHKGFRPPRRKVDIPALAPKRPGRGRPTRWRSAAGRRKKNRRNQPE